MSKTNIVECKADSNCHFDEDGELHNVPHVHETGVYENTTGPISKIYDTILDHIGYTPIVRLNRVGKNEGLKCEILAKCEYFNAGGSLKDRIGKRMVLDAERSGRIKPGDTLIEPTSGNTGIGIALSAAIKGYKTIITLPEKMSNEKVNTLKALGAQIIRTPTEAAFDSPESHIGVAKKLNEEIKNSHILDQYANPSNPLAHYDGTAEELLKQCNNKIDMIVVSAGTGGAISGLAAKIKLKLPKCIIVGVDPHGSILAQPEELNKILGSYAVEGIGYDFIPKVLNRKYVDYWVKTSDKESFEYARKLIREEGLLIGGSSGSVMVGAINAIKKYNLGPEARCVVIFPDSIRNYMSKFLSDDWMIDNNFMDDHIEDNNNKLWWWNKQVSDLKVSVPVTVLPEITCQEAIDIMVNNNYDQLPVVKNDNILGVITANILLNKITNGKILPTDSINKALIKQFKKVSLNTSLHRLSKIFNNTNYQLNFVVVSVDTKVYSNSKDCLQKSVIVGLATKMDLLNYIANHEKV